MHTYRGGHPGEKGNYEILRDRSESNLVLGGADGIRVATKCLRGKRWATRIFQKQLY